MKPIFQKSLQAVVLAGLAAPLMGNKGCEKKAAVTPLPAERELRRRVQLGVIEAPTIKLPENEVFQGREFDFKFVANAQMADVLAKSQTFSTATVDPDTIFSPEGLDNSDKQEFYNCSLPEDENGGGGLTRGMQKATWTEEASCMIHMPLGIVDGNVVDFAFKDKRGGGLSVGTIKFMAGVDFDYETYEIDANMKISSPLLRGEHAELATSVTKPYPIRSKQFGLKFFLGPLALGPSYYFTKVDNTLRELVRHTFEQSVVDLKKKWDELEPWYSMILKDCDRGVFLNAGRGSDSNLIVGDVVELVNVLYQFEGPACGSYLRGDMRNSDPIAYARVKSVGRNMSYAEIIENDPNYPTDRFCEGDRCFGRSRLKPGARAYIKKMYKPGTEGSVPVAPAPNSTTH